MSLLIRRHEPCQILDICYDLVTRALGGKSVRCVVRDNEFIFTSDIETLLSSLDTEHPELEIILQSLKSHHAQYGEGIKTFLFMATRIAKAVKQLEQLGIAHCISTKLMQEAINELTKDVHGIAIPVVALAEDSSRKPVLKESSMVAVSKTTDAERLNKCAFSIKDEAKIGFHSSFPLVKENLNDIELLDGDSFADASETDFVYLKMSKHPTKPDLEQDCDEDDVDWFFDKQVSNSPRHNDSQDLSDMKGNLNLISQGHRDQVMNIIDGKNSNSSEFDLEILRITGIDKGNKTLSKVYSKVDNHDSDFDDCFDNMNNEILLTVVECENEGQNTLRSNENRSSVHVYWKAKVLDLEKFHMKNDFEESSHISFSQSKSTCEIEDAEFNECFCQGTSTISKGNKISQFCDESNGTKTCFAQECISQSSDPKTICEKKPENEKSETENCFFNKEVSTYSEMAKLNSLLKEINTYKSHNVKQVEYSSRHFLFGQHSNNIQNQGTSDLTQSNPSSLDKNTNNTKRSKPASIVEENQNPNLQSYGAKNTEMVFSQTTKSDVLKIDKINSMLKNVSALASSVNISQIITSSRHMELPEESEQQDERNTFERFNASGSKPEQESMYQNLNEKIDAFEKYNHDKTHIPNKSPGEYKSFDSLKKKKSWNDVIFERSESSSGELSHTNSSTQSLQIPEDIGFLSRECDDLMQMTTQVYCHQSQNMMAGSEIKRLDLSKVHCVSVQSSRCDMKVVRGLVIPCSCHTLEIIGESALKRSLLITGDLKPGFVHKGYKPLVAKKVVVGSDVSLDSMSVGKEHSWAANVVTVLRKLQISVLLVKGRVADTLSDMLYRESIVVLSNVPFRVLQVLSHIHKVTPVVYIQDAALIDLCQLSYQPLDECWMDRKEESHCLLISDLPQIQTIVLQLPSTQSCHVEEERAWKCLHRLSNALEDRLVLPGYGMTELWCQNRIKALTEDWPGEFCPQIDLVMQALADVFHDYVSFVRLNVKSADDESKDNSQHSTLLLRKPISRFDIVPESKERSGSFPLLLNDNPIHQLSEVRNDKKKMENILSLGSCRTKGSHIKGDGGCYSNQDKILGNEYKESKQNIFHCDSFASKISSWSSAIDLVQVLLNLDSLVVTGASSADLCSEEVLL